ncbi:MAG: flagellar biosynthetic protein FliR [Butyrivibrio sp.]|nr:flagellar biosynthetic protein FliR [Butyrivibrio sp.]
MINYTFTYGELETFLLIFVRVSCFIFIVPFIGNRAVPNTVKIGFSLIITFLLFDNVPRGVLDYNTIFGYTVIVLKEAITGFLIGYSFMICTYIVSFAGQIVDMQVGLSMVSMFDPSSNQQITITGAMYQQVLTVMLIISGMYQYIFRAFADSYTLIPINGAVFHTDRLIESTLSFLTAYIVIGFRISMPVFIVTLILNVILGVLAKVSPQLNMFAVGMQIKVLIGLGILYLTSNMLYGASDFIFNQMKILLTDFVSSMVA